MRHIKQLVKKLLGRHKVRILLSTALLPVSYGVILLSGLFDYEWYKSQQHRKDKLLKTKATALGHYLVYGRKRGFTPNPFFVPEYLTPGNWQNAIVDPLASYIVRRKTWSRPTSVLFAPAENLIKTSSLASPLKRFIKHLAEDTMLPVDIPEESELVWADVEPVLMENVKLRRDQEVLRGSSLPVMSFNHAAEKELIDKFKDITIDMREGAPLVSIVTPAWNREALIGDAIASVQAQTLPNWELIIVDDGSTDATIDIIKQAQAGDYRIKLIEQDHGGVCRARNSALNEARGDWIAFLDSDNTWSKDFLQTMIGALTAQSKDAGYSAIEMKSGDIVRYRTTQPNPKLLEIGNYIDLNALLVRKSVLARTGFFDEGLRRMVDYDLVCRISDVTEFAYIPIIGVNYTDHNDVQRITTTELASWDGVIKSKNFINWDNTAQRTTGLTSILVPIKDDLRTAVRCMQSVMRHTELNEGTEIIILDSASSPATNATMSVFASLHANVRYVRQPASHDNTLGANYAFEQSTGEKIVLLDQRAVVEAGWLGELLAMHDSNKEGIITSLLLKGNRTILSAGVMFTDGVPVNFLEDHPLYDANKLDDILRVPAAMSGSVMVSSDIFKSLHGLNPLYDKGFEIHDFTLRAHKADIPTFVAKKSLVQNLHDSKGWGSVSQKTFYNDWRSYTQVLTQDDLWNEAGFVLERYEPQDKSNEFSKYIPVLKRKNDKNNGYRWAIKIAAPPDERRFAWGDMYFGQALANVLNNLGQQAFVDFLGAHERPTSYLDDVILDIRGLADPKPQAGKLNIMWVISHPDDVSVETVNSFDKVFAAGERWAHYMSTEANKTVEFLPQCTDPRVFFPPEKPDEEFVGKTLFVGNSRAVLRPIVADAITAGLDVAVYGGGWDGLIDKQYIKGTFIPNDKLARAYGSADIVLNDHWADMKEWGFLSNRLFDAVASGGYIVTDKVQAETASIFGNSVKVYETDSDLKNFDHTTISNQTQRLKRAKYVAKEHSFEARAARLVEYVIAHDVAN